MHRHPAGVHLAPPNTCSPPTRLVHREQGRESTVLSTRFLSSVSTKKCLDATKARSWISENQHRHKYISTKIHKYLDHCTCNEHEEKNTLGLHGAVDRLLLSVHHIQSTNYGFQLNSWHLNKVVNVEQLREGERGWGKVSNETILVWEVHDFNSV